jgi:NADH-quinone oxidoreductase subunit G
VLTASMASQRVFDAVPFYAGLTLEEIGGRGVRWHERDAASVFPRPDAPLTAPGAAPITLDPAEAVELAGWRSVWDAPEVEHSPALEFLFPRADRELV